MPRGLPDFTRFMAVDHRLETSIKVTPPPVWLQRIYDECTTFDTQQWTYEEHIPTSDGTQLIFTIPANQAGYIVKLLSKRLFSYGWYRIRLKVDPKDPNIWFYMFLYYRRGGELAASHNEADVEFIGDKPSDEVQIALYPDGESHVYPDLKLPGPIDDGAWHMVDLIYLSDLIVLSVDNTHVKTIRENIPRPPMFFLCGCESKAAGPPSDWHMYVNLIDIITSAYLPLTWHTTKIQRGGILATATTEQLLYLPNCTGELEQLILTTNTRHIELRIKKDDQQILVPFQDGSDLGHPTPAILSTISGLEPAVPVKLLYYDEVSDRYAMALTKPLSWKHNILVEIRQETGVDQNVAAFGLARWQRLI